MSLADSLPLIEFAVAAILTGLGIIISIIFSARQTRREVKARYTTIISTLGNELEQTLAREFELKDDFQCELYAEMYMDILDRIAFLAQKEKLPIETAEYFEKNFRYGRTIYKWYSDHVPENALLSDHWKNLELWFTDHPSIIAYDSDYLPPVMRDYMKKHPQKS